MTEVISLGLCILKFDYDNPVFRKYIETFPTYKEEEDAIRITIIFKQGIVDKNTKTSDSCCLDIDPSLIRKYVVTENGDCIYINSSLFIERDFSRNIMFIIYDKIARDDDYSGFIETFIANILYKIKWLTLHGAVLVKDNSAVAFLGKSRSGKSSTVIQLLDQASGILCNDLFCLNLNNTEIKSIDKVFGVRTGNNLYIDSLVRQRLTGNEFYRNEQVYYSLEENEGIEYIKTSNLKKIVFCSVSDKSSDITIKRIYGIEIFKNFMDSCICLSKKIEIDYLYLFEIIRCNYDCYKLVLPNFNLKTDINKNIFSADFLENLLSGGYK